MARRHVFIVHLDFLPLPATFQLCHQSSIIVRLGLTNTPDEVRSLLPNYSLTEILPLASTCVPQCTRRYTHTIALLVIAATPPRCFTGSAR
jgi:hypothetical protein